MSVPLLICIIGCDVMVITSIKAALLLAERKEDYLLCMYICTNTVLYQERLQLLSPMGGLVQYVPRPSYELLVLLVLEISSS